MKHYLSQPPLAIARADGVWLYDYNGKAYLDAVSSWWVNLFGHNHPRIKSALHRQLDTLEHVMLAGLTHAPVVELSERLAQLAQLPHVFYASDGASAVEIALKMSAHYWRQQGQATKTQFVHLAQSYHGETLGALGVTDIALFKQHYTALLMSGTPVTSPDARLAHSGESAEQYALRAADALETYLAQHQHRVAAFILEPLVQCATGMGMYHPTYLARARAICTRYGVLLIADEIAVGFGRTGYFFGCEAAQVVPDMMCLSKGMSGGYLPLAAVLTSADIFAAFYKDTISQGFLHSHSYTGNPLGCAAALATLDIFSSEDVIAKNQLKVDDLAQALADLDLPVEHKRQQGMIVAFDVITNHPHFASRCVKESLARGVLLRPIGNTVYWMPPYCISREEIKFLAEVTSATVRAALQ